MLRKSVQSLCLAGFLACPASLALANHVDTAEVALACTQYGIKVKSGDLASNATYSVRYSFVLVSASGGPPITISNTVPIASTSDVFTDTVAMPLPLSGEYGVKSPSGSASLLQNGEMANTVDITFSPTTLNCAPPS
jgi:hypothetical protein